jgi:hypothetical protein
MEAVVTRELALKCVLMGACKAPTIGTKISQISTSHLIWAEDREIVSKTDLKKLTGNTLPLWVLSGYGDGSGDGYGSGSGSGSGYGDGSGYGYGYGDGYGSGYGDGDGYGSGYGDGDGLDLGSLA